LALFVPIAAVPVEADRYLVASLALSACLVAAGVSPIVDRISTRHGRIAAAGLILMCGAQAGWTGIVSAMSGRTTTPLEARHWCETHLRDTDLILSEAYGPNLLTYSQRAQVLRSPVFEAASPSARTIYRSQ